MDFFFGTPLPEPLFLPPLTGLLQRYFSLSGMSMLILYGADGGSRTHTSRLGRPADYRYPTRAIGAVNGNRTRTPALARQEATFTS